MKEVLSKDCVTERNRWVLDYLKMHTEEICKAYVKADDFDGYLYTGTSKDQMSYAKSISKRGLKYELFPWQVESLLKDAVEIAIDISYIRGRVREHFLSSVVANNRSLKAFVKPLPGT